VEYVDATTTQAVSVTLQSAYWSDSLCVGQRYDSWSGSGYSSVWVHL